MRKLWSLFLALTLISSSGIAFAKRSPPKPVPPIESAGIRFSVPHEPLMGCVVATEIRNGHLIWKRQVYTVRFNPKIEGDVQACYITSIKIDSGKLQVTNEIGNIYEVDLETLEVHPLKGSLVVQGKP